MGARVELLLPWWMRGVVSAGVEKGIGGDGGAGARPHQLVSMAAHAHLGPTASPGGLWLAIDTTVQRKSCWFGPTAPRAARNGYFC